MSDFQVGQNVYHRKLGEVCSINSTFFSYPVGVEFENCGFIEYTPDGKLDINGNRSLFFSEPKVQGETERPFEPTYINGDLLLVWDGVDQSTCELVRVVSETSEGIFVYEFCYGGSRYKLNKDWKIIPLKELLVKS